MNQQGDFFEEAELAERAARAAGAAVMALYGKDYQIRDKGRGNPVTAADLEANRRIREILLQRFPDDGWLSEEDVDNPKRRQAARVWVVDPIDGTKEFIEGVPQFAVSIGLVVAGRPVVSVVYNPATERLFRAVRGQGAAVNGKSIHVSSRSEVDGSLLLVSRSEPRRKFEVFAARCRIEPVGSIAYRLALIAEGRGDATLTLRTIREWDICGGVLMVEEAGGMVLDGSGRRLGFNQETASHRAIVAANRTLAPALQAMLAQALKQEEQRKRF
ncbi:MAG TPA: 3'(2'),5'-bisphosphate nucleotidase CysQ [Candidatus Acidoferrales bacterium]|nr:3'(2'),5'-bisphosphate nucleotidase CysQ [Candidatus Acidoferrales bacterium]